MSSRSGSQARFQVGRVGRGSGRGAEALDRGVEMQQRIPGDGRGDLGADAELHDRLMRDEQPVGAAYRGEHRCHVERGDRTQVDDLGRNSFSCNGFGGCERLVDHARHRDDRDVVARAHDGCLAQRQDVVRRRLRAL